MGSLAAALLFPSVALAIPPGLKRAESIACTGTEELVLTRRYIDAPEGDGVVAEGTCKVTLTDCHVVARGHAVSAAGDAVVVIRNSTLRGGKSALYLGDRARASARGNTYSGGILVMGRADYDDQGGNETQRTAEATVVAPAEEVGDEVGDQGDSPGSGAGTVLPEDLRKSRPVVCRKNVKAITVKKRVIEAKRDGIVIYGNCVVTVEQSLITSDRWAVAHNGKGKLVIKDSVLEGGRGALLVRYPTATIEVAGSTLKGKLEKPAGVEIDDQGGNTFVARD